MTDNVFTVCVAIGACAPVANALQLPVWSSQTSPVEQPPTREDDQVDAGLWPTPKLLDSLLTRLADRATESYDLDEHQQDHVREAVVSRWQTFLNQHRQGLQPLLNEYLEMRMSVEPPASEDVQAWAQRAAPLFESLRDELAVGTNDIRDVLTGKKKARFEKRVLDLGLALGYAEGQLKKWGAGDVDPKNFWHSPARSNNRSSPQRTEDRQATEPAVATVGAATDPLTEELDAWAQFVAQFVKNHRLDKGQQTTAQSVLTELTHRARAHGTLHRTEIGRLEAAIQSGAPSNQSLADIKLKLVELYGPIDAMFLELQQRLEALLTLRQLSPTKTANHPKEETPVTNRPQDVRISKSRTE